MTDWREQCVELEGLLTKLHELVHADGRFLLDEDSGAGVYGVELDISIDESLARTRAELAQPESEGLTNQEIEQWADATPDVPREALDPDSACWHRSFSSEKFCDTIRSALEYWCVTPQAQCSAIKPVPVSERLPGLKDCDTKGRCWFIDDDEKWCPVILGDILDEPDAIRRIINHYGYTHWVQGWALPVPTSQEAKK